MQWRVCTPRAKVLGLSVRSNMRILMISLDTNIGRQRRARANFAFERLPGVRALDAPRWVHERMRTIPQCSEATRAARVGVFAAHVLALEHIISSRIEGAIVLEDDAVLSGTIPSANELPRDEACYLGGCLIHPKSLAKNKQFWKDELPLLVDGELITGVNVVEYDRYRVMGMYAVYYPTPEAAARVLDQLLGATTIRHIDLTLNRLRAIKYLYYPNVFHHDDKGETQNAEAWGLSGQRYCPPKVKPPRQLRVVRESRLENRSNEPQQPAAAPQIVASSASAENTICRVVYINLARRVDRREHLLNELKDWKVPVVRFDAVEHDDEALTRRARAQIGCALSHIAVLKKLQDDGVACALVLEDDFEWSVDSSVVSCSLNAVLSDETWGVCFLAGNGTKLARTPEEALLACPQRTYRSNGRLAGSHRQEARSVQTASGYLVRLHYLPTLLQFWNERMPALIDQARLRGKATSAMHDMNWKQLQKRDHGKWIVTNPVVGRQWPNHSDIEGGFRNYGV